VEFIGGDSGSVSLLRSPLVTARWLSVYVFLISAAVASMKPWGSYI
jgi:hypothetical protein